MPTAIYCAPCNQAHDVSIPCQAARTLLDQANRIHLLEERLEGWRGSDTTVLIQQRDDARKALQKARRALRDARKALQLARQVIGIRHPAPVPPAFPTYPHGQWIEVLT